MTDAADLHRTSDFLTRVFKSIRSAPDLEELGVVERTWKATRAYAQHAELHDDIEAALTQRTRELAEVALMP